MSQKALDLYLQNAKKGSMLIVDPDLVKTDTIKGYDVVKIPAMKTADELGLRLVSNMVMLGALVQKSGLFSLEVLEKAIVEVLGPKSQLNIDAIHAGAKLV